MANRVRIRARGLAALLTSYKIKQSSGGSIKKAKEQLDKEKNAQNNLEDKA